MRLRQTDTLQPKQNKGSNMGGKRVVFLPSIFKILSDECDGRKRIDETGGEKEKRGRRITNTFGEVRIMLFATMVE